VRASIFLGVLTVSLSLRNTLTTTTHGHHIPGTTIDDEGKHVEPAKCGGPGHCLDCTHEELKAFDLKGDKE
jgi:hypothetical protein